MMLMRKLFFLNYHSYISTVFDHQYDILISAWGCAIRSDMLKFGTPNFVKNVSDTVLWNGETEKRKESYYNGHLRNTWRWSWLCRNKVLQGMVKWNDTYVSIFKLLLKFFIDWAQKLSELSGVGNIQSNIVFINIKSYLLNFNFLWYEIHCIRNLPTFSKFI